MTLSHCFKVRSFILTVALISGIGLGFAPPAFSQQNLYSYLIDTNNKTWTKLDLPQGGYADPGSARALNDFGQVTGELPTPTGPHAFITGPNGVGIRDLGIFLGADTTSGAVINNAGQVAGIAGDPTSGYTLDAFITGANGMDPKMLDDNSGDRAFPGGINEAGQVAVTISGKYSASAFITGPNGEGMRDIGDLGGINRWGIDADAAASGINETGQVVGYSDAVGKSGMAGGLHAFITGPNGMGMRDLGTLGGNYSSALGINDAGQVVGQSRLTAGDEPFHAFITGPDGMGMRDLGTLGGVASRARDINNVGQVVGDYYTVGDDYYSSHAFITGPNGEGMTDLNSLVDLPQGAILTHAIDINNNGQVIAWGSGPTTMIPEPETYALMLAGLGLIGFMAWRKKRVPYDR